MAQAGEPPENAGRKWTDGLTRGRNWTGSAFDGMLREEEPVEAIQARQFGERLSVCREKYPDLDAFEVSITFLRHETWCQRWFNHFTFDRGQSDEVVIVSFHKFVCRMEEFVRSGGKYCLMGADDPWRGDKDDDLPPCRCARYCKDGLIRMNH